MGAQPIWGVIMQFFADRSGLSSSMGSTETTFYTIAVYTSAVGIKNIRFVLIPALVADFVGICASVIIWHILS